MTARVKDKCSSHTSKRSGDICADGFVQTFGCWGPVCHSCGVSSGKYIPHCMREDLPEHFSKEDGSTIFYPRPS